MKLATRIKNVRVYDGFITFVVEQKVKMLIRNWENELKVAFL